MNKELLDNLVFQASAQVSPLLEGKEWQKVYNEKLAELIVKKCATVIKDCEKYGHSLPLEFEVMNHFGVEE
jgi:hypothetical protein